LGRIEDEDQRRRDYAERIGHQTDSLVRQLTRYVRLPESVQAQISDQVSGLIGQAREGDSASQQILGGVRGRLLEQNINTASLPSLDWEPKESPPKL